MEIDYVHVSYILRKCVLFIAHKITNKGNVLDFDFVYNII